MLKTLNAQQIVNSYRHVMGLDVSKSKRMELIESIPHIKAVTNNFKYISDGRVNVAKISFTLAAEIDFINSIVETINDILTNKIKKAQKMADKMADNHQGSFIGLTLDDAAGSIKFNPKRAVNILSGFLNGSELHLNAVITGLTNGLKN